ncbi:hypothetical protein AtNW77_Chr4g0320071 [Arabidopsis thaliana]|uniref:Uncharacterized protein n=4 Tax=Arabidopsis TaxID=3701 RepID=A0A654FXN5_ARATH|nr:uncharacterized protein AT4G40011 [Arabidopsis thaliana]KAG7619053.1 hypothetical protein ISN45_At04g042460 [Arabidopsis thaliana x Arabidopsis arenosa]KAG7623522.1 hypothetical protein ISN44_As04g042180 [Arabidopsis suecica]AEE87153.1 hypothetical protein AT4G40011 [Arabidopsis thaliana]CAA0398074.1 unnamed protein product [Arabidopsis thaliana]VYS65464.1 unnamed protein product [Arabidopsis thaliana]|eukprot:NP_001119146.1 hypothetical protein AT4G40011 [Arabidopsis thaliana]
MKRQTKFNGLQVHHLVPVLVVHVFERCHVSNGPIFNNNIDGPTVSWAHKGKLVLTVSVRMSVYKYANM